MGFSVQFLSIHQNHGIPVWTGSFRSWMQADLIELVAADLWLQRFWGGAKPEFQSMERDWIGIQVWCLLDITVFPIWTKQASKDREKCQAVAVLGRMGGRREGFIWAHTARTWSSRTASVMPLELFTTPFKHTSGSSLQSLWDPKQSWE